MQNKNTKVSKILDQIEADIRRYIPISTIANKYNINRATIHLRFKTLLKEIRKEKDNNNEKTIIKMYEGGFKIQEITKLTGLSFCYVKKFLNKNHKIVVKTNNHNQKYSYNTEYFRCIDDERKAYFLGLFYADGCVSVRKIKDKPNTFNKMAKISLKRDDDYLLKELSFDVYGVDRVKYYKYKGERAKYQDAAYLSVCNKDFCDILISKGCVTKKSLVLCWPEFYIVPESIFHHFLRGYFDGDGSIGSYKKAEHHKRRLYFSICGSQMFIAKAAAFLKKILNVDCYIHVISPNGFSTLQVSNQFDIRRIHDYLYKDVSIFMTRKQKVFANHYAQL